MDKIGGDFTPSHFQKVPRGHLAFNLESPQRAGRVTGYLLLDCRNLHERCVINCALQIVPVSKRKMADAHVLARQMVNNKIDCMLNYIGRAIRMTFMML
ncbi:hypothetical protein DC439_25480 (plasmid) [Agrobacterium tumefaciens]|nr:hypothetical protein DC439_25480 [Agrobacterium tumefaciens]